MAYTMHFRAIGSLAATLAFGLSGCSMHPLPEDVSRATTADIVARIRCEAKEGLESFRRQPLSPKDIEHVKLIVDNTTIGFEFDFNIEEDNKASGGRLEFEKPSGSFSLVLTADLNSGRQAARSNRRAFRILESLGELRGAACGGIDTQRRNPVHPITGATGMAEVVRTYIELELLTDVARGDDGVVFSDELSFTTTFEAGVTPDWTLDTPVGSLRLTRATITGSAKRHDVHAVTVALARKKEDVDPAATEGRARPKERNNVGAVVKVRFPNVQVEKVQLETKQPEQTRPRDVRSPGVQRNFVKREVDARNRVLLELQERRNRKEDRAVVERVLGGPLP